MTRPAPVLFLHVATQYVITDIRSFKLYKILVNNAAAATSALLRHSYIVSAVSLQRGSDISERIEGPLHALHDAEDEEHRVEEQQQDVARAART